MFSSSWSVRFLCSFLKILIELRRNSTSSTKLFLKAWIILNSRSLRLLPVVVEVFEVLLYSVNRLVGLVDSLIMLRWIDVRWKRVCEISWNVQRRMLSEEALHEFLDEIPAENWHQTRTIVHLD